MPESAEDLAATFAVPCTYCRMSVMWTHTVTGEKIPVDVQPTQFGDIRLYRDGRRLASQVAATPTERRRLLHGGWPLFHAHRLSCPKASDWARGHGTVRRVAVSTPEVGGLW